MIPLSGITCCFAAAGFFLFSRITGRDAEILRSVTRVCHLKDLAELFEGENKVSALMVAVSGRVGSDTPINSEISGINCVLLEEAVEKHFRKRDWFTWVKGIAMLQPVSKEVPWYLDDETGRVNVAGAQDATGFLAMTVGSKVFEKAEPPSFVQEIMQFLKGFRMVGVKRSEHVLPIGTPLTVVGEAVKDGTGNIRIQNPEIGTFCVSPVPINQLIKMGNFSRGFKYASLGLAVVGVILIIKPVGKFIRKSIEDSRSEDIPEEMWWQKWQGVIYAVAERLELVTRESERQHENTSDVTSRDSEIFTSRDSEGSDLCVICLERKYNTVFVQCGHTCCCITCAMNFVGKDCPLCRRRISQVLRTYRP